MRRDRDRDLCPVTGLPLAPPSPTPQFMPAVVVENCGFDCECRPGEECPVVGMIVPRSDWEPLS